MLENVLFLTKLVLIAFAVANMEQLRGRLRLAAAAGEVEAMAGTRALAIGALALWLAVIVAGRLTAYPHLVAGLFGGI